MIKIFFPPHCSHRLQSLDVSFMAPLSRNYSNEVRKWLRTHYPRVVTEYQIPELFGIAYIKSANMMTDLNGFRKTGISLLNPEVFGDWIFEPSETTNRSFSEMDSATPNLESQTQTISQQDVSLTSCSEPEPLPSTSIASFTIASPTEIVSIPNGKTQTVETKNACTACKRATKSADRQNCDTCKENVPRKVYPQRFL